MEKVDNYGMAKIIAKQTEDHIKYTMDKSTFALESDDAEFIFVISVRNTSNEPFTYSFKFLQGKAEHQSGVERSRSKAFRFIVLPNTAEFRKEIEEKEILIVGKKKLLQIFGEQYKPI